MTRLRDEIDSPDPIVSEAARLIAEVPPLAPSEARLRRVRRALDEGRSRRPVVRVSVALGMALTLAGTAGAVMAVSQWKDVTAVWSGTGQTESTKGSPAAEPSPSLPQKEGPKSEDVLAEARKTGTEQSASTGSPGSAAQAASSKNTMSQAATPQQERSTRSEAPRPNDASSSERTTLSEARLMQQAVEALRRSGDTKKADELLKQYRQTSSSGQLDEEALALSIEVALARKDGKAATYARQYLARYPAGKFVPLAKRALSSEVPAPRQ